MISNTLLAMIISIIVLACRICAADSFGAGKNVIEYKRSRNAAQMKLNMADLACKKKYGSDYKKYIPCYQDAQAQFLKDLEKASTILQRQPSNESEKQ